MSIKTKSLKLIKAYGFKFFMISALDAFFIRLPDNFIYHYLHSIKYRYVKKYIYSNYSKKISNIKRKISRKSDTEQIIENTKYVWVFWWQGLESAPELVRQCISNIKKNLGDKRKVIIVSKNNYNNYISVPSTILTKVENGTFTFTLFADYVRFCLLSKYGGIWCDATIFINDRFKLPDNFKFFTVKHGLYSNWHVCAGKWSSFFLACGKNNNGIFFVKELLEEYMIKEQIFIAYLLVDDLIKIAYEEIPSFKEEVDKVPFNNANVFKLNKELDNIYKSNYSIPSQINKLSYKQQHKKIKNGEKTVYGKICEIS